MEAGMAFEVSNLPVLLHNDRLPSSDVLDSPWISNPSSFHGSTSMVNYIAPQEHNNMTTPFFTQLETEENGDEEYDQYSHQPEKKRRLTADQVQFLERSFEVENKLEPDRKFQLAKELSLQPRQVAIWFQNRRARYKTKQLEKEYGILKTSYDKLKVDCGSLEKENEKLKHEVLPLLDRIFQRCSVRSRFRHEVDLLMEKLIHREQRKVGSNQCKLIKSIDIEPPMRRSIVSSRDVTNVVYKVEDANSAKSDILDSEVDSSHVFEREHSDFSQDEEDEDLSRSLLHPPRFPKVEEGSYIDASVDSCNLGYPNFAEDDSFWLWPN